MKNTTTKILLALTIAIPSMSFAFFDSVNDGLDKVSKSAKKTADMSNQAQANIDKVKNIPENYSANADTDFDAKEYASKKIDENTNNALSNSKETANNLKETKDAINKTKKSLSSFF